MTSKPLSRRHVLRGMGGVTIGLPLLEAMGCTRPDGEVVAASSKALDSGGDLCPKRLFVYGTGNGAVMDDYFPVRRSDTDFDLSPSMQLEQLAGHEESFADLKDQMVTIDGVQMDVMPGSHESHVALMTGFRGAGGDSKLGRGRSIDRKIADLIRAADPTAPEHLVLATGTQGNSWNATLSYESDQTPSEKHRNATNLFETLFASAEEPEAGVERRRKRRSLLDDALEDYSQLRGRVSGEDRRRLDDHMQRIRELEMRLSAGSRSCSSAELPDSTSGLNHSRHLPEVTHSMFQVIELAFACDITRVATFMSRCEGETTDHTFPWLSFAYCKEGIDGSLCEYCRDGENDRARCSDDRGDAQRLSHHGMSHLIQNRDRHEEIRRYLLEVMRWQFTQFAGFARRLRDVSEGTGTLLDASLCVHTSGNAGYHSTRRLPFTTLGGLGGTIPTGRALEANVQINDVWLSVLRAFGGTDAKFGDEAYCSGDGVAGLLA